MLDERGEALYVGKAKSLKKRCRPTPRRKACRRLQRMVALTRVNGVRHHRERGRGAAARGQPDQAVPAAVQHRPARRQELHLPAHRPRVPADRQASRRQAAGAEYFGPFASAGAVNDTLNALLKAAFPLRSCRDSIFAPHPALPAIPDQALLGALRRPGRRRDLQEDRRGGARVPLRQVRRGADPCRARCSTPAAARLRARGRPARPAQGHGAHPGAAGHQSPRRSRTPTSSQASGGRAGLHPGVLYRAGRPGTAPTTRHTRTRRRARSSRRSWRSSTPSGCRRGWCCRWSRCPSRRCWPRPGRARRAQGRAGWCRVAAADGSWSR